jgi:hypothetical protein
VWIVILAEEQRQGQWRAAMKVVLLCFRVHERMKKKLAFGILTTSAMGTSVRARDDDLLEPRDVGNGQLQEETQRPQIKENDGLCEIRDPIFSTKSASCIEQDSPVASLIGSASMVGMDAAQGHG